jgi:hypothetical protein
MLINPSIAMRTVRTIALYGFVSGFFVFAGIVGCGQKAHKPAGDAGVSSPFWQVNLSGKDRIPGIDQGSATEGQCGGRLAFVVWTDLTGAFRFESTDSDGGFIWAGHHGNPGDQQVDCRCATRDGTNGVVTINGKTFDLARGGLFLVSTLGNPAQVRQLKRDNLRASDKLWEIAKND